MADTSSGRARARAARDSGRRVPERRTPQRRPRVGPSWPAPCRSSGAAPRPRPRRGILDDDHAMTDWWILAHVTHTIVMVGLPCAGKTAGSCFFKRGCEGRYSCRTSSFSGTAHRIGRNRYLGTNHLPGGSSRGPAANPRSLVHTEEGIRTVRLQRRRAPRRRRAPQDKKTL